MIDKVLTMVFGSKHERDVKAMRPVVAQINALEPQISALSDDGLRAKTEEFRSGSAPPCRRWKKSRKKSPATRTAIKAAQADLQAALDEILPEAFAVCREAGKRVLNMRHFDVQLMGGIVLHKGKIAEMKTGEGQDPRGHAAGLPQRPDRPRRPRRHRQRLPRPPRLRVDGPPLHVPRPHRRRHPEPARRPRAPGRVPLRHHLRHEQRVRLRLPARQHEVRPRGHGPARPGLRDRRRGRLHPHRRSPHAAHHQRPLGRVHRQVLHRRAHRAEARRRRWTTRSTRSSTPPCSPRTACCTRRSSWAGSSCTTRRTWTCSTPSTRPCAQRSLYQADVEYVVNDGEVIIVDEFTGRLCPAAAGRTACTRPSRPRKASGSSRRTRPSPRSPSRTSSACTRSSPA